MNRLNYALKEARKERKERKLRDQWRNQPENLAKLTELIDQCQWVSDHLQEIPKDSDGYVSDASIEAMILDTVTDIYYDIPYYAVTTKELILIMRANLAVGIGLDYEISSFFKTNEI